MTQAIVLVSEQDFLVLYNLPLNNNLEDSETHLVHFSPIIMPDMTSFKNQTQAIFRLLRVETSLFKLAVPKVFTIKKFFCNYTNSPLIRKGILLSTMSP